MNLAQRILLFAGLALPGACTSSPGTITGALPDTGFVRTQERHYVFSRVQGWLIAGLDGRIHRRLFDTAYSVKDISDDGNFFVLTNSGTDLFITSNGGRRIRAVPFFRKRLGAAAISPDGRRVAATRHPDFSKPQKDWVEDETIYVIDTRTLKVKKAGRYRSNNGRGAASIDWLDGRRLRIMVIGDDLLIADMNSTARKWVKQQNDPLHRSRRWKSQNRRRPDCGGKLKLRGWRGDQGLDLVRAGRAARRLVSITGRSRGYHDYMATISDMRFSRDCRYVTFDFEHRAWVAEISTGKTGPLMAGQSWIFRLWHPAGLE